jgi:hypothetical protein
MNDQHAGQLTQRELALSEKVSNGEGRNYSALSLFFSGIYYVKRRDRLIGLDDSKGGRSISQVMTQCHDN